MLYTSFKLTPSQKGFIFENHDKMTQREIVAAIHIGTKTLQKFLKAHGLKLKGSIKKETNEKHKSDSRNI